MEQHSIENEDFSSNFGNKIVRQAKRHAKAATFITLVYFLAFIV